MGKTEVKFSFVSVKKFNNKKNKDSKDEDGSMTKFMAKL